MKTIKLLTVMLLTTLFLTNVHAADPVAIIIKAKGKITIKNSVTGKSLKAKRGTRLTSGDKIVTGKKGRLAIKFIDDNSLVRVRPNSSLTIKTEKKKSSVAKNIFVEVGSIFSRITKQKSAFRVTTPTSVASVKGTAFWTVQKIKGATQYFGEEGVVEISNDAGVALMRTGETGIVTSKKSKPIVRKTRSGEGPSEEESSSDSDSFEFEFEDENGNKKLLKFEAKKAKE